MDWVKKVNGPLIQMSQTVLSIECQLGKVIFVFRPNLAHETTQTRCSVVLLDEIQLQAVKDVGDAQMVGLCCLCIKQTDKQFGFLTLLHLSRVSMGT